MDLTKQQKLIINSEGNCVVVASPGSGKTFVLSELIKIELSKIKDHQGIIAISYTNKASLELRNRSLENGINKRNSFFGTIDKFFISEIIIPFGKQVFGLAISPFIVVKYETLSLQEKESIPWFSKDLKDNNIEADLVDQFGDLFRTGKIVIESIGLLANHIYNKSTAVKNYIKARYTTLYIDEYQDSGYHQHLLFTSLIELGLIGKVVGDENQSIYYFSNKDPKYLRELTKRSDFNKFYLSKNHRSHPSIINYSNFLLDENCELIPEDDIRIYFWKINGAEKDIAATIDSYLPSIIKKFKVDKMNEITILTRTRRTAEIIDSYLKAPHRLFFTTSLDNNLNIWSSLFSKLLCYIYSKNTQFIDVIEQYSSYEKLSKLKLKNLKIEKKFLDFVKYTDSIIDSNDIIQSFINIARIIAPNSENLDSEILLYDVFKSESLIGYYQGTGEDEIHIQTIHKAKGLEYKVVLHLDLCEWVFPKKTPGPYSDFNNCVYPELEQDLNLHYVAITRAQEACILISSTFRTNSNFDRKKGSPSEFLTYPLGIDKLRFKRR